MLRSLPHLRVLATSLVLAVLAAAPPAAAQQAATGAVVKMMDTFEFDPHAVTIHAGEAVEWHNASRFKHSVTADPKLGSAALPAGAEPFASGELQPGESFRRVLTVPGKYRYFCTPHEGIGMSGTITVLPN
ncbi:MAG: plastocyanin/azurin family copper-binding protein [Stellaceae bacterium]